MTHDQFVEYQTRTRKRSTVVACGTSSESDLQEKIETYCRSNGLAYVRTRMDKATTFTMPGVPDFVIALPCGKTAWVECKSAKGKQTPAQAGFQIMLERSGHSYKLVRSYDEFTIFLTSEIDWEFA